LRKEQQLVDALERRVGELSILGGNASASAGSAAHGTLTEALRRQSDLLPVTLDEGASSNERRLVRHLLRLAETLAELGDNLIGGDASDHNTATVPLSHPIRGAPATCERVW
jgi:hypothetical protein